MRFKVVSGQFAIAQLPAGSPVPTWANHGAFSSVTATPEELSIVCQESAVPEGTTAQRGFTCLQLEGPFPLDSVGILHKFLGPLVKERIPIFAISTFNTDFILIHAERKKLALEVLQRAGNELVS
jgi:hypothetical protein